MELGPGPRGTRSPNSGPGPHGTRSPVEVGPGAGCIHMVFLHGDFTWCFYTHLLSHRGSLCIPHYYTDFQYLSVAVHRFKASTAFHIHFHIVTVMICLGLGYQVAI